MFSNKQAQSFPGREFYQSGGANWPPFILWLFLPFAAAVLLAFGLFELFNYGEYYVIILPLIAAAGVAVLIHLAVARGHCRSPLVGGLIGAAAGLVLYFGYFYFGMIYHLGPKAVDRLDVLPRYIQARMHSDVIRDVGTDSDEQTKTNKSDPRFNWFTFGIELVCCAGAPGIAGFLRARKPYCRACHQWMVREITFFQIGQTTSIVEALRSGSANALAALAATPVFATIPNVTLGLEICPARREGRPCECPFYVSLKQVTNAKYNTSSDNFEAVSGKIILRSLRLDANELTALGSRFKIPGLTTVPAAATASQSETATASAASAATGPVVEIIPVEREYAGRVLTRRNSYIALASVFGGLLFIFAGLALALWGGMMAFPDKNSPQDVPPEKKVIGITSLSVGGLVFGGTAIFFLVNPLFFSNRFFLRRTREEFSRRPKCLVDPNDPAALFTEIVPKLNWGRALLETATDVGFLKVDAARREILFEGDKERFRIPADSITSCKLEVFVEGQGSYAARAIYYAVVQANRPNQFWEVPLRERHGTGKFGGGKRKQSAEKLFAEIQQIRGTVSASVGVWQLK